MKATRKTREAFPPTSGQKQPPRSAARIPGKRGRTLPRKTTEGVSRSTHLNRPSHLDDEGRIRMVDVSDKPVTSRRAAAEARIRMSPRTLAAIRDSKVPKGDVGAAVMIAAIQAAKKTSDFIPLCHPLSLDHIEVKTRFEKNEMIIVAEAMTTSRTGVEMEAMTAAAIGALVVYDMVKSMERGVEIGPVRLLEKEGGRSGRWTRAGSR